MNIKIRRKFPRNLLKMSVFNLSIKQSNSFTFSQASLKIRFWAEYSIWSSIHSKFPQKKLCSSFGCLDSRCCQVALSSTYSLHFVVLIDDVLLDKLARVGQILREAKKSFFEEENCFFANPGNVSQLKLKCGWQIFDWHLTWKKFSKFAKKVLSLIISNCLIWNVATLGFEKGRRRRFVSFSYYSI